MLLQTEEGNVCTGGEIWGWLEEREASFQQFKGLKIAVGDAAREGKSPQAKSFYGQD